MEEEKVAPLERDARQDADEFGSADGKIVQDADTGSSHDRLHLADDAGAAKAALGMFV